MNYRHAYHAGNFADVVKHIALVTALLHLRKKDAPFAVIDTHAGRGRYDLASDEAARTGEAEAGIARLRSLSAEAALCEYLRIVGDGASYPGSPLIAAALLRPQDRLVAIEKHPEEFAALRSARAGIANARPEQGDGYEHLRALLPPPERRGLILVDPPFEAVDEFERQAEAMHMALRRFATGVYLVWFPIKTGAAGDALCGELLNAGAKKLLRIDIDLGVDGSQLTAAG